MALSLSSSAAEGDGDLDSRLDGVFAFWDGIPFDEIIGSSRNVARVGWGACFLGEASLESVL